MNGWSLRFYVHENRRYHGVPLYEWLLEQANLRGIRGGSAFRAIAGFGRHGTIMEQGFFELAGQSTVLVEFLVSAAETDELLRIAGDTGEPLFHVRFPVEFGMLRDPRTDRPRSDDTSG